MRRQIQVINRVMIKAIKRIKMRISPLNPLPKQAAWAARLRRRMLISRWNYWDPLTAVNMLCFGKTGKSQLAMSLVKKKNLPAPGSHLFSSWETKDNFLWLWSNSKFISAGDDQTVSLPQSKAVCLSLSTCSITIHSEKKRSHSICAMRISPLVTVWVKFL